METKKVPFHVTLGVLSVFLVINCSFVVNPMMTSLASFYEQSGIAYSTVLMLSTIVSLMVIPCSLISGAIAGKKIKYRSLAILSLVLALVGGIGPYFIRNFYCVLGFRALVGAAIGFASSLSSALVSRLFPGDKAATMQGIGTTVNNLAGVAYQFLAGVICTINVHYTWFVHLILIIPLAFVVLFLKEPEPVAKAETQTQTPSSKGGLPAMVFLISIAWGLIFMAYNPMGLNMSSILVSEGIGNETLAGTIGSLYTVGGMVAGVIFGKLYHHLGKFIIPFAMICEVVGLALGYWSTSAALLMVGSFLTGLAIFTIWPASIMEFTEALPPEKIVTASGIFTACLGLGGFLTSPYVAIITKVSGSTSPRLPILVGVILAAVIGAIWSVASISKKKA